MERTTISKILVTGSTGQIGSELTLELRNRFGNDNVVAAGHKRKPHDALLTSGPFEYLDATDMGELTNIVERYDIDTIYHLAAVLSAIGEKNPQLLWRVNMNCLYNVLELARKKNLRVFWPSSIAVFGPDSPRLNTPQNTVTIPSTMYGVSKVAGELLCNYYAKTYSLDVRSVRYPGIISHVTLPGGGTTDYAIEIFYEAIKNNCYTCFLRKDTVLPMMYMPDCIDAAINLMDEDSSKITCRTSYNLAGISFSPEELVAEIIECLPDFTCEYQPDFRQKIADSWPMSIDDNFAREEWKWQPRYDLKAMTRDMLEKLTPRLTSKP